MRNSLAFLFLHPPLLNGVPQMIILTVKWQASIIAYAVPLVKRPTYSGVIGGMYGLVGLYLPFPQTSL